jgi:hypothetical protein
VVLDSDDGLNPKITTRSGEDAVAEKLLRTDKFRANTTESMIADVATQPVAEHG